MYWDAHGLGGDPGETPGPLLEDPGAPQGCLFEGLETCWGALGTLFGQF